MTEEIKRERKFLVVGSRSVGKTALTIQFTEQRFQEDYNPTIESTHKTIIKHRNKKFSADIIDTAGQDKMSIFQQRHSIGMDGYAIVYSITNRPSFNLVRDLNEKILNATGNENIPRIIVGTKRDLEAERKVSLEEGQQLARELKCCHVECSAKLNEHVSDVFHILLDKVEGTEGIPADEDHGSKGPVCIIS